MSDEQEQSEVIQNHPTEIKLLVFIVLKYVAQKQSSTYQIPYNHSSPYFHSKSVGHNELN